MIISTFFIALTKKKFKYKKITKGLIKIFGSLLVSGGEFPNKI